MGTGNICGSYRLLSILREEKPPCLTQLQGLDLEPIPTGSSLGEVVVVAVQEIAPLQRDVWALEPFARVFL